MSVVPLSIWSVRSCCAQGIEATGIRQRHSIFRVCNSSGREKRSTIIQLYRYHGCRTIARHRAQCWQHGSTCARRPARCRLGLCALSLETESCKSYSLLEAASVHDRRKSGLIVTQRFMLPGRSGDKGSRRLRRTLEWRALRTLIYWCVPPVARSSANQRLPIAGEQCSSSIAERSPVRRTGRRQSMLFFAICAAQVLQWNRI